MLERGEINYAKYQIIPKRRFKNTQNSPQLEVRFYRVDKKQQTVSDYWLFYKKYS